MTAAPGRRLRGEQLNDPRRPYATVETMCASAEPTIYFEDLTPGRTFDLGTLIIDEAEMVAFAQRFDPQWYHVDRPRAEASRWGRLIASGFFTVSALMRMYVDGVLTRAAADTSPGMENLRWLAPVFAGDELNAVLTVTDAQPSSRSPSSGRSSCSGRCSAATRWYCR